MIVSFFSFTSRDNLLFFLAVMLHLQYAKTQTELPKAFCHILSTLNLATFYIKFIQIILTFKN